MRPRPGLPAFDQIYDEAVLGRDFVEFRDYYRHARSRYRRTAQEIAGLGLPPGTRHLDIGGGQMALLCKDLFGFEGAVGDVVPTAAQDVLAQGLSFERVNLMDDALQTEAPYGLVTLLEVIEHLPVPPYLILRKLQNLLAPAGFLVITTPNGFRIRNILKMLANCEVLDMYRYPEGDQPLGHQHEYTLRQMQWQIAESGFSPVVLRTFNSGWRGVSPAAHLAHWATLPFSVFPHLRDGLMIVLRAPDLATP